MPSSFWTKQEKEILDQHFLTIKWNLLLELLPNKTSKQILSRGAKLGLKKENENLETYYDDEKRGWIERIKVFTDSDIYHVTYVYPAPKNVNIEECKKALEKKYTKLFFGNNIISKQYLELLNETGVKHSKELFELFWEVKTNAFFNKKTPNPKERLEKIILKEIKEAELNC